MIRKGRTKSILTGGHFPYNNKFNKPVPQFTGGLFEFIFQDIDIDIGILELIYETYDIELLEKQIFSVLDSSALPNDKWLRCNSNYNNERDFFKNVQMDAYNKFGLPCTYYQVSYDKTYNPIFGEDGNQIIYKELKNIKMYGKVPKETKIWNKFGLEYVDIFTMWCSKIHFEENSESYIPKMGDYILVNFNSNLYEIVEIKEEGSGSQNTQFIQSKGYSWKFILKPFRVKSNVGLHPDLANSSIAKYIKVKDIFNISNAVEAKFENIKSTIPWGIPTVTVPTLLVTEQGYYIITETGLYIQI